MKNYILVIALIFSVFSGFAQVFNGTGGNIPYGYYAYYDIEVSGVGNIDCNFEVCIDISHNRLADVDVALISPSNNYIFLTTDNGGYGDDYTSTCFSMDATTNITNGTAPFTGTFVPEGDLSDFDGQNANGTWQLAILDDFFYVSGTLDSWSLNFPDCPSNCDEGQEEYTLNLYDSYGDGWDHGTGHLVTIDGVDYGGFDFATGTFYSYDICLDSNSCYQISFTDGGPWEYECSFELLNSSGEVVFSGDDNTVLENIGENCGCTDPVACNYDPDAIQDDGSCFYSSLTVDECEVLYCASESGEQSTSNTTIEYLTIPITESGILNELYYDIGWHDQGWCSVAGSQSSGVRIRLYNQANQLINQLVNLSQGCPVPNYVYFESTDSYDLVVEEGYYIQVEAWRQYFGWQSYINLADVSFTVQTETLNVGEDATLELCPNDTEVNLFDYLSSGIDESGSWSPALPGGHLGTFNPQNNPEGIYTYTVQGECLTDEATVNVNVIDILTPEIFVTVDTICSGTSSVAYYAYDINNGSTYSWTVNGGNVIGSSNVNTLQVDWSSTPSGTISDAIVLTEFLDGCTTSTAIDVIIVDNPLPILYIDDSEICLGESINVSANAIYDDYQWTPSFINSSSGVFTPSSILDNQISVTITGDGGCTTSESIDFTIYENPTVNLSVGDSEICMSDSLVLISNPGYDDYSWTPSSISGNTDVYYPSSSSEDMISLTVTGDGGCTSTDSLNIVVYDLPVVNLTIDNTEICIGESISLSTTAGYNNYDWSPSAISSDSDTYTPTSLDDNQVSVTITADGGCTSSDSVNITVFDLPIVGLSIDDTDLCMGDSLVVNSTPGYNDYSWIPSSISGNTDVYYPSSSSENLISLTITGEGGCTSSESLDIAVYDLPIVNLAIDNTEICIGESISLTTTAGYNNYDWSPSAISSDSDTYTPTSLDDNQISVTITSEGGCTSSDSVNITVFDLPIVGLSIDDTDLCMGDSLVVNSTPGYNDYSWIPSSISGNTDVYYPSSSSENLISLTITGEGGCTSSESLDIAVYDLPIVNLAIDNTEICIGESISLSTTAGYNNYDWSPSVISSDSDTYTPTSLDDNQVSVTITADGGCTSSDSVSVTIYDLPIVEVSLSDSVICLGESITVNSTSGFVNYEWTPTLINTSNVMTPLISETNYFVEVTDSNGCISNDDANLIINESTPISLSVNGSNATTICIGEEIDLFATPGFDLYTWSIASLSSNQGSYIPSDLSDNQFSVIGTNQFGCNSSASLNITINSIPTPSLISVFADSIQTSPQNINLCEGISNVKFSSIISSESNPVEWLFASGNGAVIESGQNTSELVVSFPEVEDYILEFREYGSENCYTPQQIEVKVNPKPVLDLTYVEDCYKDSVFFTNNSSVDTTIQSVSWLVDGLSFDSYDLVYPLDNNNKVFELTIVDVLNCSSSLSTSFVPSDRPYVDFYHEPEKITILDPEVSFVNLSSNGNNVSWSFGDNQISNEWEPIHTYDSLGWFEVVLKVQNDEGCADSISKQLLIENNLIYYFPSSFTPDGDGLNDDFGVSGFRTEKIQNYQFQITNRWGEIVFYSENINEKWDGKISKGNDAMPGSYLWSVRIVDELGKVTRKFGDFTLLR